MKIAGVISVMVVAIYGILLLGQLWGSWFDWSMFVKITVTAVAIVVVVGLIALIWQEIVEEKSMKEDKYID